MYRRTSLAPHFNFIIVLLKYGFISSVTATLILWPCTIIIYLTPGMNFEHNKYGNDRYRKGAVTQRPDAQIDTALATSESAG